MKFLYKFFVAMLIMALLGFALVPFAFAQFVEEEGTYILGAEEVVDDDLFIAAEEVFIHGTVNGDVFVGTGRLIVDGVINGDLYAGAGEATISGYIRDDLIIGTGTLILDSAEIGDSLIFGTGTAKIDKDTKIGGSVIYGAGVVEMGAHVFRNLIGGGGTVEISGIVERNSFLAADVLRLNSEAVLNGNLKYSSEEELVMAEGAVVLGGIEEVLKNPAPEINFAPAWNFMRGGFMIMAFLAYLIVGLLVIYFFPKQSQELTRQVFENPLKSVFVGLAVLVVVPITMILLMMTVIGMPLAILMGLLYVIGLMLVKVSAGVVLGDIIAKGMKWRKANPYWLYVMGLFAFFLLKFVALMIHPALNTFVCIVAFLFAFGAMSLVGEGVFTKFRKGKV